MARKILCLALLVSVASAALWQGRPPQKPEEFANQEGCYIPEVNNVVPYGSEITPIGSCLSITCVLHNSGSWIVYASCGVVNTNDPNCYVTETDVSVSYPKCCPTVKCDFDNNLK